MRAPLHFEDQLQAAVTESFRHAVLAGHDPSCGVAKARAGTLSEVPRGKWPLVEKFLSELWRDPEICPHVADFKKAPLPIFAALWVPGEISCRKCMGPHWWPSPPESVTCDGCRRVDEETRVSSVLAGPLTIWVGLCRSCTPPLGRAARRNDPCPCLSGRKFKKCCGR